MSQLVAGQHGDSDALGCMVGYSDGVTLRTLLRHSLGKGLSEIKAA